MMGHFRRTLYAALLGSLGLLSGLGLPEAAAEVQTKEAPAYVKGTVAREDGSPLVYANVYLVGRPEGTYTRADGSFGFPVEGSGTFTLCASYVASAVWTQEITVAAGDTLEVRIVLEERPMEMPLVEVSADRQLSTEAAVLADRMKAATIADGISAEQISRSSDATSADALKRVTGLSVIDNKYVFIRGVTDRYNGTMLDGVAVSSTDTNVDKKSFSFDLIPSNLLANAVVVKTVSPDMPGDFSGGLVRVNTLESVDRATLRVAVSGSYDSDTYGGDLLRSQGGHRDWMGFDDGSRNLPGDGNLKGDNLARALPNTWATRSDKAPLNRSASLSYGDRWRVGAGELDFVGAANYRNGFRVAQFHRRPISPGGTPIFDLTGTRYMSSVLAGGLANLHYRPSSLHRLSLRNSFVQSAQDKVIMSGGITESSGSPVERRSIEWTQRSLFVSQLSGEHTLPALGNLGLEWKAFVSRSKAAEPDRKYAEVACMGDYCSYNEDYRTWSDLSEVSRGGSADLTYPLGESRVRAGFLTEDRNRTFEAQAFYTDVSKLSPENYPLLILPIEKMFDPENYGAGKFHLGTWGPFVGEYDAEQDLRAGYAMIDHGFSAGGQRFRLAGGARLENCRQTVDTRTTEETTDVLLEKTDVLPSANLTYLVNERMNLRLAYGQSVNRPEFRELANVLYYDFERGQNVIGNPDLTRALVRSYDVRMEMFPGMGEVLAGSFFYKNLSHAIEEDLKEAPERYVRSWFNSPKGRNWGWEVEVRKSLAFLGGTFDRLFFSGNYTRVESQIEYTERRTSSNGSHIFEKKTRPMQGQAPWTVNLSLLFTEPSWGTSMNLLYHESGRRLAFVGDARYMDVYEEPRAVVDLVVGQQLPRGLNAKLTLQDLGGRDEVLTSNGAKRSVHSRYSNSTRCSFTLSFQI